MHNCQRCFYPCDGNFCTRCGAKITPPEKNPLCNWCFSELFYATNFCPGCGKTIAEALETQPSFFLRRKSIITIKWVSILVLIASIILSRYL
jgi:predicted amidophosphoribosyltransferase